MDKLQWKELRPSRQIARELKIAMQTSLRRSGMRSQPVGRCEGSCS